MVFETTKRVKVAKRLEYRKYIRVYESYNPGEGNHSLQPFEDVELEDDELEGFVPDDIDVVVDVVVVVDDDADDKGFCGAST